MYQYQTQKSRIFTEQGQEMFILIRDNVHKLLKEAGAIRMQEAMRGCTGDSWDLLACVDRLAELKEICEIPQQGQVPGQHRIFVSAKG